MVSSEACNPTTTSYPTAFFTGSWDDDFNNSVTVYRIENTKLSSEDAVAMNEPTESTFRFVKDCALWIPGDVTEIRCLPEGRCLVSNSVGDLTLIEVSEDSPGQNCLRKIHSWEKLHQIGSLNCACTSVSEFGYKGEAVTSGEDGKLRKVDLRRGTESAIGNQEERGCSGIYCLQHYAQDQVVAGSGGAQLQLWDLRRDVSEGPGVRSTIPVASPRGNSVTSVACHPAQSHLVVAGTQQGATAFCDLRQPKSPPSSLLPVHSGAVWEVMYHPVYSENLFTCGDDGLLLHWDASSLRQGSLRSVEETHQLSPWLLGDALADKVNLTNLNSEQILPINSVDVVNDWVICGTDSESVDLVTDLVMK